MKSDRPNILFIMTDQHHWRALSAMGNPDIQTPNLDRLVREGTTFRKAYCASPVCGPSRMSLATGLPPHEHGYVLNKAADWTWEEQGLTSFGHHLQAADYSTYWVGKWHAPQFIAQTEEDTPGFTSLVVTDVPEGCHDYVGWDIDTSWVTRAVEFLQAPPEKPFFLGVSIHNPHDICYWIMKDKWPQVVEGVKRDGQPLPPLPDNFAIDPNEPEIVNHRRTVKHDGPEVQWTLEWTPEEWQEYLYAYYRLVEKADQEVGRILDALEAGGLAENTLVVFTSDHGEGCAAHHLVVKLSPYEASLRVPLVVRYPGRVPAGEIVEMQVASGLDLGQTILDYAGSQPMPQSRGISLREVLSGEKAQLRDFIVSEIFPDILEPDRSARIVCTTDYKYLFATRGEQTEEALYDLQRDPGETHSVAAYPEHQTALAEMRARLTGWMRETNDPLLDLLGATGKAY